MIRKKLTYLSQISFPAILLAFGVSLGHADTLRDHLSVFFEFNALDSVIALEQKSATSLQVTVVDGATGETRSLREDVGAKPMQKLLSESNDLGLKTLPLATAPIEPVQKLSPKPETTAEKIESMPPDSHPPESTNRSVSTQRKNRMWYISTQSILSTYVYGISIPLALDMSTKAKVATPMIIAPFAFGAHFWYAKNRPFEDAHRKGVSYLSLSSIYASYALPFSIIDEPDKAFRVSSFLTIATYPLGIWAGYELGNKYVELPGRIDTQEKFAIGFGIM